MAKWPQSANRTLEIISGEPVCFCGDSAVRFVSATWGFGQTSDHPVCDKHLQQYHVDFDRLGVELRRLARESREGDAA